MSQNYASVPEISKLHDVWRGYHQLSLKYYPERKKVDIESSQSRSVDEIQGKVVVFDTDLHLLIVQDIHDFLQLDKTQELFRRISEGFSTRRGSTDMEGMLNLDAQKAKSKLHALVSLDCEFPPSTPSASGEWDVEEEIGRREMAWKGKIVKRTKV